MEVTITAAAERFMRRMLRYGGKPGGGLRLRVTAGGCSGLAGEFSVEAAPRGEESVLEHNGIRIFLPQESRLLLAGVTIDFADTPMQTGLVFQDPKAKACTCSGGPASSVAVSSIGRRR